MSYRTYFMHALTRLGLERAVVSYWKLIGRPTDYLDGDRAKRFSTIYKSNRWSGARADRPSRSGNGSTLPATSSLRSALPECLASIGTKVLLDVGCGDYFWMRTVDLPCDYVGIDIVDEVIVDDQRSFGDERHRFLCIDACLEPLPPADTALCREVLFHLGFSDGKALLANLKSSGIRYLLATSDPGVRFNADVPTGAFRDINLERRPYELGPPIATLSDGDGSNSRRVIGVWRIA